ncbi:MAG: hypothetical protein JST67_09925 [Bacteroidetes bacterium]|nr:hypothetical protein [Bacteroidota bacterium]
MDILLEILKLLIPSGAVFAATYFIIKKFSDSEQKRRDYELRKAMLSMTTPIRLQAYERIIIFLERIEPTTLVLRTNKAGMNAPMLYTELIKAVKTEYEHNISQQIYVSANAWHLVKTAKEETLKLINISISKVPDNAKAQDLAQIILQIASGVEKTPTQISIDFLKKEVAQHF